MNFYLLTHTKTCSVITFDNDTINENSNLSMEIVILQIVDKRIIIIKFHFVDKILATIIKSLHFIILAINIMTIIFAVVVSERTKAVLQLPSNRARST